MIHNLLCLFLARGQASRMLQAMLDACSNPGIPPSKGNPRGTPLKSEELRDAPGNAQALLGDAQPEPEPEPYLKTFSADQQRSSCEISRSLGITQKSAWFMLHRIRLAMQSGSLVKIDGRESGGVEADETFIGGKARNMHLSVRQRRITGTGAKDKIAVMGVLERGG
jgi:hypothetical protein